VCVCQAVSIWKKQCLALGDTKPARLDEDATEAYDDMFEEDLEQDAKFSVPTATRTKVGDGSRVYSIGSVFSFGCGWGCHVKVIIVIGRSPEHCPPQERARARRRRQKEVP